MCVFSHERCLYTYIQYAITFIEVHSEFCVQALNWMTLTQTSVITIVAAALIVPLSHLAAIIIIALTVEATLYYIESLYVQANYLIFVDSAEKFSSAKITVYLQL